MNPKGFDHLRPGAAERQRCVELDLACQGGGSAALIQPVSRATWSTARHGPDSSGGSGGTCVAQRSSRLGGVAAVSSPRGVPARQLSRRSRQSRS